MLGGVGALAYNIYDLRHPDEQAKPDPNKKTLVILGMYGIYISSGICVGRNGN